MDAQLSLLADEPIGAPAPEGLVYREELIAHDDEAALLSALQALRWDPIVIRGQAARRTARHFGRGYDYASRTPEPGEAMPDWLMPARARAAALAKRDPDELVEALVQRYPPGSTIGWHRDAPAFGIVIGLSLNSSCRMRFRRGTGPDRRTWELELHPRSGYILDGEARSHWEHAIPPATDLRYSITFRTLRHG